MQRLLVTSAGGTVGPLIIRMISEALPEKTELVAADATVDVSDLPNISKAVHLPMADDPLYSSALLEVVRENHIDAILPLADEESLLVSKMAAEGRLPIKYLGMDYAALVVVMDKLICAERLADEGIDVPICLPIKNMDDLEKKLARFGYPEKQVVFKPISARGSRGFRIIDADTDRLAEFYRRDGQIFIDLEMLKAGFAKRPDAVSNYFLMEFLPGASASIDLVAWKGEALGIFPHFRLGNKFRFVDVAEIRRDTEMEAYCKRVIAALGMHGLCNIELGYRQDGSVSLIEVNGRTSATAYQNKLVGANCFRMLLDADMGRISVFEFNKPARYRVLSEFYEASRK